MDVEIASSFCNQGATCSSSYQNIFTYIKYVALCNIRGREVARGMVQTMDVDSILSGHPIWMANEIVFVWSIKDESADVYELHMATMEECMNKIIRWPHSQTKELRPMYAINLVQTES